MANPTLAAMRSHYRIDEAEIAAAIVALDGLGETFVSSQYANFIDLINSVFDDSLRGNCLSSDICLQGQSGRSYRCVRTWGQNNVGEIFEIINDLTGETMFAVQDNTDPLYYLLRKRLGDDRKRWFIEFTDGDPVEDVDYDDNEYESKWPLAGDIEGSATGGLEPQDASQDNADFTQPNLALPLGDISKEEVTGSILSPFDLYIYFLQATVAYDAVNELDSAEILVEVSRDGGTIWDPIIQEVVSGQGVAESQGAISYEPHTTLLWRISASTDGVASPATQFSMSDVSLNWNSQYPLIKSFG